MTLRPAQMCLIFIFYLFSKFCFVVWFVSQTSLYNPIETIIYSTSEMKIIGIENIFFVLLNTKIIIKRLA